MTELTDEEKAVLKALSELEPATLEEISALSGLPTSQVKEILEALSKKRLLDSLNTGDSDSDESVSS